LKSHTSKNATVKKTKRSAIVEIPTRGHESFGVVFSANIDLLDGAVVNDKTIQSLLSVRGYTKAILMGALVHDHKTGLTYEQLANKYRVSKNTVSRHIQNARLQAKAHAKFFKKRAA
jgi:hypothetical protein